ncbi:uncharacterized protein METZ01_LOCUS514213, partial [marine metagenome]
PGGVRSLPRLGPAERGGGGTSRQRIHETRVDTVPRVEGRL